MAWYNNWGDLTGDIKDIATGHNPMNQPAPVGIPAGGPHTGMPSGSPTPATTGQQISVYNSGTSGTGGSTMGGNGDSSGDGSSADSGNSNGILNTGISYLDLLKLLGSGASAYAQYQQGQSALDERKAEAAAANQITQEQSAMRASSQLNRAPLADKGQYLALNNTAPTPFQPRDYTQGLNQLTGQAQGGAAAQLAANAQAAANYKAGDGGVNTNTLKMVLAKLGYNQQVPTPIKGAPIPPGATPPGRLV